MKDSLIIATKYKKTIEYILKITDNFPHKELNLKSRIINTCFDVLEFIYVCDKKYIIAKLKMLDYYLKLSYEKKIISKRKYEVVSNYLLEVLKMVFSWVKE